MTPLSSDEIISIYSSINFEIIYLITILLISSSLLCIAYNFDLNSISNSIIGVWAVFIMLTFIFYIAYIFYRDKK